MPARDVSSQSAGGCDREPQRAESIGSLRELRQICQSRFARVVVLGLGRHGSGLAVCRFLTRRGLSVVALDDDPKRTEQLRRQVGQRAAEFAIPVHTAADGGSAALRGSQLLVVSPAVPPNHPLVLEAEALGIPVTTEVAIFLAHCPATVVAITGTNGKSTTAITLYRMLKRSGARAWLGGNIGRSLLSQLDRIRAGDRVVLEVSSFQLHWLDRLRYSPPHAVVTSLAPDHLHWHGSEAAYVAAKQTVLRYQKPSDWYVLNVASRRLRGWRSAGVRYEVGYEPVERGVVIGRRGLLIRPVGRGRERFVPWPASCMQLAEHYRQDLALGTAAAVLLGATEDAVRTVLARPRLLPHRMQVAARIGGRVFVDDSAATTPHAAVSALEAWRGAPLWVILGGEDKGIDLMPLARAVAQRAAGAALLGRTAPALKEALALCGFHRFRQCANLDEAVDWCWQQSRPGAVILLAPGCASTDQFADYRERGRAFRSAARALRQRRG